MMSAERTRMGPVVWRELTYVRINEKKKKEQKSCLILNIEGEKENSLLKQEMFFPFLSLSLIFFWICLSVSRMEKSLSQVRREEEGEGGG